MTETHGAWSTWKLTIATACPVPGRPMAPAFAQFRLTGGFARGTRQPLPNPVVYFADADARKRSLATVRTGSMSDPNRLPRGFGDRWPVSGSPIWRWAAETVISLNKVKIYSKVSAARPFPSIQKTL
jgi:hypothetical protein